MQLFDSLTKQFSQVESFSHCGKTTSVVMLKTLGNLLSEIASLGLSNFVSIGLSNFILSRLHPHLPTIISSVSEAVSLLNVNV